jgi:hypothetical protein
LRQGFVVNDLCSLIRQVKQVEFFKVGYKVQEQFIELVLSQFGLLVRQL